MEVINAVLALTKDYGLTVGIVATLAVLAFVFMKRNYRLSFKVDLGPK